MTTRVEALDGRRRIGEIPVLAAQIGDQCEAAAAPQLGLERALLQAEQLDPGNTGQGEESLQRGGAERTAVEVATAGPDETDLQALRKRRDQGRRSATRVLRNREPSGGRQIVARDAQETGQRQQGRLEIDSRATLARFKEPDHAVAGGEQAGQTRLGQECDLGAQRRDQRNETQRQDHVAVALLGHQKDRLAGQALTAPKRQGGMQRRQFSGLPAPLVVRPGRGVIAEVQQDFGPPEMAGRMVGLDP